MIFDVEKKYWLYLHGDTFLWCKAHKGMVYNSANGKGFAFENKGEVARLTEKLSDILNLYCIGVVESELSCAPIAQWISDIQRIGAGGVREYAENERKPICYYPMLNLQKDVKKLENNNDHSQWEDLNTYLHEITIYLNGEETGSDLFNKQIIYPPVTHETIDWEKLEYFLFCSVKYYVAQINICGDLFQYDHWADLYRILQKMNAKITVYMTLQTLIKKSHELEQWPYSGLDIRVIADGEYNGSDMVRVYGLLKEKNNVGWVFPVASESQVLKAEGIIESTCLQHTQLMPVYTGDNISFFEENIFLEEDDILSVPWNKREIFARQVMNTSFFGQLVITPQGNVHSNLNLPPLGTLQTPINQMLRHEMYEGRAWRMIRDGSPCCDCINQWLCPSPSNYELVIGRLDLCKSHA